ncbi:MAG: phenylacetate--CoA ligase family protein [Candidatus Hecatellaceae archaeon]
MHTSSGTTSKPVASFYSARDLENWSNLTARNLVAIGARKGDIFLNTSSQGVFTGGLGYIQGAQMVGLMVVPLGSASPEKQLEYMRDFGVTVFHAVPSFALRLAETARRLGVAGELKLRLAILGAETWTETMRSKIEEALGLEAFNNYGFAEACGPGVAVECMVREGLHVWEDHFLLEVVDPKTGEQVGVEEEGELVVTPLTREAMPLLRYRTGDIAKLLDVKSCDCGRTHRKISWIKGRVDDMVKVRGVGLYPSAVERIVASKKECNGHYLIVVRNLDELSLQVEVEDSTIKDSEQLKHLKEQLEKELKKATMLRFNVNLLPPGTLPRSTGKTKRIIDERTWQPHRET